MAEDKSAVDEFLGKEEEERSPFQAEPNPFPHKEEKEEGTSEEEADDKVPFHKDPKILRFVEKQVEKALKQHPQSEFRSETSRFKEETQDELTDVLTRIIGNDTDEKRRAVTDFKRALEGRDQKVRDSFLQEIEAQEEEQRAEDRRVQNELDQGFEEIEETFNVDLTSNTPTSRKVRSDFVDYVRKIAPKNEEGEVASFPDLVAAFEEFQDRSRRSAPTNRAKELASRSMSQSKDASNAPQQGGKSWKDVDRLFSRLSK